MAPSNQLWTSAAPQWWGRSTTAPEPLPLDRWILALRHLAPIGPTVVVNVRRSEYDVYMGRFDPQRGDGYFGNPAKFGRCNHCHHSHNHRLDVVGCYRAYFTFRLTADESFRDRLLECRGKRLGCFCAPALCHADVVAEFLNANTPTHRPRTRTGSSDSKEPDVRVFRVGRREAGGRAHD